MVRNYLRVLVTGGTRFVDSHLVDRLLKESFEVTVIGNLGTGRLENIVRHQAKEEFHFIKGVHGNVIFQIDCNQVSRHIKTQGLLFS